MRLQDLNDDLAQWDKHYAEGIHLRTHPVEFPAVKVARRVAALYAVEGIPNLANWPDYRGNGPTIGPRELYRYLFGEGQ
jgi:hypothetical protein